MMLSSNGFCKEPKDGENQVNNTISRSAKFKGDDAKLYSFLSDKLVYPDSCKKAGIEDVVYVNFIINTTGAVTNAKVHKSSGIKGFDDEALRVVNLTSGNWEPAYSEAKHKKVRCKYELPIRFELKTKLFDKKNKKQ